jgi:secondary thiamine-phosphate synthase enzyme
MYDNAPINGQLLSFVPILGTHMQITNDGFEIETDDVFDIQSVTPQVGSIIEKIDAEDGLVYASTPHTSAALSTNEYETKLLYDMVDFFSELVPPDAGYAHDIDHYERNEQPNAHAHILSAMIKRPVLLVLQNGELNLGSWEEIMFYELCGPRTRTVDVAVLH